MTISMGFSLADASDLSKGMGRGRVIQGQVIQGRMNRRCLLKEVE
ncbi:MAG TPA: hypothetical protein PLX18_00610 [Anaerohalosphaeraceae bacterium]|nr:hypothetical protein [Anaerohalosphaeraceae bacterium]HOT71851.1 hypothetical protein [Anaerohalosphaeraceae bacterium]HPC65591.1 hypothetical protein [Anaerohalosphaeraceae bacterium]HQG04823.1 hypothetical protein [Anaerohalosphaeraceae bacterium]HQI06347.1 hypothetical protein [Anaerohalosphaeraceae bacterium]